MWEDVRQMYETSVFTTFLSLDHIPFPCLSLSKCNPGNPTERQLPKNPPLYLVLPFYTLTTSLASIVRLLSLSAYPNCMARVKRTIPNHGQAHRIHPPTKSCRWPGRPPLQPQKWVTTFPANYWSKSAQSKNVGVDILKLPVSHLVLFPGRSRKPIPSLELRGADRHPYAGPCLILDLPEELLAKILSYLVPQGTVFHVMPKNQRTMSQIFGTPASGRWLRDNFGIAAPASVCCRFADTCYILLHGDNQWVIEIAFDTLMPHICGPTHSFEQTNCRLFDVKPNSILPLTHRSAQFVNNMILMVKMRARKSLHEG